MAIDLQDLRSKFVERFGGEPRVFRAPGRVNLIGEHTDYNGGFVLPMAIDREVAVAASLRDDRKVRVYAANFGETAEFDLDNEGVRKKGFWLNYIEGMARILERQDIRLKGVDMLVWSDVPTGAGLSSSAALEIAAGLTFTEMSGQRIDRAVLAKAGQQTEHEFVGARVGIMDQFVSAHARSGHALLLDCRSLEYEHVPLAQKETAVVICDSNIKHDLARSDYNTRREECEKAVKIFAKYLPKVGELRDVSFADFEEYSEKLPDAIRRRARHVITENERTLKASEALKKGDMELFGKLMRQSHESLRFDYEVSRRELDLLVEIADNTEGVLGARMTGGGFGGSTVNLVKRECLGKFEEKIRIEYKRQTEIEPTILVSEAGSGASEVNIGSEFKISSFQVDALNSELIRV